MDLHEFTAGIIVVRYLDGGVNLNHAIAAALREAENRAAWAGFEEGREYGVNVERCCEDSASTVLADFTARFGPRQEAKK